MGSELNSCRDIGLLVTIMERENKYLIQKGCIRMDDINCLVRLRKEKGVSRQKCCEETGISLSSLKRYEHGKPIGDIYILQKLATYYDVALETLITNDKKALP